MNTVGLGHPRAQHFRRGLLKVAALTASIHGASVEQPSMDSVMNWGTQVKSKRRPRRSK
ncbi:hypothetical protein O9992_29550 [Vibrio lentus]|nr:hypothetical protein [Vibrio lentus]